MGNEIGGIGPGKIADMLILDDYKKIKINKVILGGKIVVSDGKLLQKQRRHDLGRYHCRKQEHAEQRQPASYDWWKDENVDLQNREQ